MKLNYVTESVINGLIYSSPTQFGEGIILHSNGLVFGQFNSLVKMYELDVSAYTIFDLTNPYQLESEIRLALLISFKDTWMNFIDKLDSIDFESARPIKISEIPEYLSKVFKSTVHCSEIERINLLKNLELNFDKYELFKVNSEQGVCFFLKVNSIGFSETGEMSNLVSFLNHHVTLETGLKDKSVWQEIENKFPNFQYHGIAYRALILGKESEIYYKELNSPYYSWALSKEGAIEFLTSHPFDTYEKVKVFIIEANIRGISIVHMIQKIKQENYPMSKISASNLFSFMPEDEVIILENYGIIKTEEFDLKSIDLSKFTEE